MWYEAKIPFSGVLDCQGLRERMVDDITCQIGHKELEVKADTDGEERIVGLEIVLDLDMKIYEEEQTEILSDIYGVTREMEAVAGVGKLKQLLMKTWEKPRSPAALRWRRDCLKCSSSATASVIYRWRKRRLWTKACVLPVRRR